MAMKRKVKSKEEAEAVRMSAVWRVIQDSATATHGCLLPQGEVTLPIVLSWTREEVLGMLKRSGKILSWAWEKGWENGNERRYAVTIDTAKL